MSVMRTYRDRSGATDVSVCFSSLIGRKMTRSKVESIFIDIASREPDPSNYDEVDFDLLLIRENGNEEVLKTIPIRGERANITQ